MKKLVSVIGAGQMGSGISQVFATSGYSVRTFDVAGEILERSQHNILYSLQKLYSKELIKEDPQKILSRIEFFTDFERLRGSPIFIESAFEDFSIKTKIFKQIGLLVTPTTYVASNTSSYSITALSKMLPFPERFVGFHFMNPPPIMELLELVRGLYTSDETFKFFGKLAKELGKTVIVSRNTPGFVLNRILIPMINEAIYALYEGVSTAEQIDTALKLGANHPIGPLALADLIGLDTVLAIMRTLHKEMGEEKYKPCPMLENYVARGRLGKKTKKGFYEY